MSKLVFVIGIGRSGTTLLTNILNEHSGVIAPPEQNFLLPFLNRFNGKDHLSDRDIDAYVKYMWTRDRDYKELWGLDAKELKKVLKNGERDFESVFMNTIRFYCPEKEEAILVDKNPFYTLNLKLIKKTFPNAKFIALIRDFRDRHVSVEKHYGGSIVSTVVRSSLWSRFNQEILNLKNENEDQCHIIRYEDMVLESEASIREVCEFLNIGFKIEMLTQKKRRMIVKEEGEVQVAMNEMHKQSFEPISSLKIGQWKEKLSDGVMREITFFNGEMAEKLGYTEVLKLGEQDVKDIKRKYLFRYKFGKILLWLNIKSYSLPLWLQKLLIDFYRRFILKG